jgi:hypothetical protein
MSISHRSNSDGPHDTDWLCLLFLGPTFPVSDVDALLSDHPYPSDFVEPITPDFLFFAVALLGWQVRQIATSLDIINENLLGAGAGKATDDFDELENIRTYLFNWRRDHLSLSRRRMFASDFAGQLNLCFREIEARSSNPGNAAKYPPTLERRVRTEESKLQTLLHDLDTMPLRLDALQAAVSSLLTR